MGVANYDVAVMNYPLFEKGRLSGEEANKLFAVRGIPISAVRGPYPCISIFLFAIVCAISAFTIGCWLRETGDWYRNLSMP